MVLEVPLKVWPPAIFAAGPLRWPDPPAFASLVRRRASGWSMLVRIEFPLALPAILAALRTGLTLSITGALVGEFVSNSGQGLGALVFLAKDQFNAPLMFATLIILAVLAAVYYGSTWSLVKLANTIY